MHFLLAVLNIYVSLEGIDRNLISAARTFGCTSWQAFKEVSAALAARSARRSPALLRACRRQLCDAADRSPSRDALFGNLVFDTIMDELNWPLGSTLSIVLLVLLGLASVDL